MLVISGDTPTTSRLYDALAVGAIPVILSDHLFETGLPFMSTVPWHAMVFWIPERSINGHAVHELILNATEESIESRRLYVLKHRDDVLWNSPDTRIVENILIDAKFSCL